VPLDEVRRSRASRTRKAAVRRRFVEVPLEDESADPVAALMNDFLASGFVPISQQNIKASLKEALNVMANKPLLALSWGREEEA
jgi:hypothetical protein